MSARGKRDAARRALALRLGDLLRAEDRAAALEPEGVHQVRVAARRLRAALSTLGDDPVLEKLERKVKGLQDALGAVRDTQVQLQWAEATAEGEASRALAKHLEAAIEPQRAALARALDRWRRRDAPRLTAAVGAAKVQALGSRGMREQLERDVRRLQRELRSIDDLGQPATAHSLRIAVKRLRYRAELLEQVSPRRMKALAGELKALQTTLGDLHDVDVRRVHLEALFAHAIRTRRASLRRLLSEVEVRRAELAGEAWQALQEWAGSRRAARR